MTQLRNRFYKGRPVKRIRRGYQAGESKLGIVLTFVSPTKGVPGEQETISQADWDKHGEWRPVQSKRMDDLRKLVTVSV